MKKRNFFTPLILLLLVSFTISYGQAPSEIHFRGETITMPENIASFNWNQMPESSKLNGGFVGWVQFYNTPSQETQDLFKANKMDLIEYIPHQTYLFHFPQDTSIELLAREGVRSIIPLPNRVKLTEKLKAGDFDFWAWQGDQLLVTIEYHKQANLDDVLDDLKLTHSRVIETFPNFNVIDLAINPNSLDAIAERSYVKVINLVAEPATPDDDRGRGLHRSNSLDNAIGGGRNYTGEGIGIVVRDDGRVGPHIDFQGRITNYSNAGGGSHGDGVAGITSGAGNLLPANRGMATGSYVYAVNYINHFLDYPTNNLIDTGAAQITNSSYSDGCNQGYTNIAKTVDEQTHETRSLLHVFSAGNNNGQNCGYGAGGQWGNITGGHKQGKNIIATANVYFDASLVSSSSRGPATDGRIKPDITAHGQGQVSTNENNTYQSFGGTSAAAPGIAGVSAQLYQAYSELNNGQLPSSALIKAALLNTANDLGNEGPDFKYGWGLVNGLRAVKLLEDERYLSDEITQGVVKTHNINIPAGTKQVRFMVYWHDEPAASGANPALVNDLDLTVKTPSNTTLLPWVLDHTPNATNLNLPATTGVDHLNNVEQVLINNPSAGNYEVSIQGFNVPVGPQEYFLVYEVITDNLTLTYPIGGEFFAINSKEVIQWDAINTTEDFTLEYSVDNGNTWTHITTVPNTVNLYEWSVPSNPTGKALIKVKSGSYESISETNFNIARTPSIVNIDMVCEDFATFTWNSIPGADTYKLYILGEKYMEVAATSTTTSVTIPIDDPNDEIWYALSALSEADGWEGQRSRAKFYAGGLKDCVVGISDNVFARNISLYPNPATSEVNIGFSDATYDVQKITISNSLGQVLTTSTQIDTSTQTTIDVSGYAPGIYFVTIHAGANTTTKKLVIR